MSHIDFVEMAMSHRPRSLSRGGSRGGGVLGVRTPPFWGTPKLHKEGKNVARVRAKTPCFST